MQVEWELMYQNITLYKVIAETENFFSSNDTFGTKLAFGIEIESNFGLDQRDLISLGGEILWQTDSVTLPSTFTIPDQPVYSGRPFIVPMSRQVVRQIEEARNGGQVALQIALHGLCNVPPDHAPEVNSQFRGFIEPQFKWLRGRTTMLRSNRHTLVSIHREKWAELLKGMNHASYRLVELPAFDLRSRQAERWDTVLSRFDSVIQKQRMGNFEECIEESRKIVDELIPILAAHLNLDLSNNKISGQSVEKLFEKALSKYPRQADHLGSYKNLMFSITRFSSVYHHAGQRPSIFGNLREQANLVTMLTASAITAAAQILLWEPAEMPVDES